MTTFTNKNKSTAPTWANASKHSANFKNKLRSGTGLTWDGAGDLTWDDLDDVTWQQLDLTVWVNKSKN